MKVEFEDPEADKPRRKQRLEDLCKGEDPYLYNPTRISLCALCRLSNIEDVLLW
jgi:hypothetical protein